MPKYQDQTALNRILTVQQTVPEGDSKMTSNFNRSRPVTATRFRRTGAKPSSERGRRGPPAQAPAKRERPQMNTRSTHEEEAPPGWKNSIAGILGKILNGEDIVAEIPEPPQEENQPKAENNLTGSKLRREEHQNG